MKFITITSIFFVFCFLLLVFLSTKGVVYSDEGYILYGASRILAGQLPFKDFHFVYTPLSLYATAFAFFIFGKSILAGRILMIILSMITSVILYIFSGYVTQNIWIRFLVVILYIA